MPASSSPTSTATFVTASCCFSSPDVILLLLQGHFVDEEADVSAGMIIKL